MKPILIILSIMGLSIMLATCARQNVFNEPPASPVIDSIKPAFGKIGTQLRLYGSGFSISPSGNTVSINGITVRVDSPSTSTVLLVTVIDSTGTGPVGVKVKGKEGSGPVFTWLTNTDAPVITKAAYGWADGKGYSVNVENLPVQDTAIKLLVNGKQILMDHIVRPGHNLYKPDEGDQLLIVENTIVENHVPLNLADFTVVGNGRASNTQRLILNPHLIKLDTLQVAAGDTLTITGIFLGDRSYPSRAIMTWEDTLSPDPAVISWSNTQIKLKIPAYNEIQPSLGGVPPGGYAGVKLDVTVADKISRFPQYFYYKVKTDSVPTPVNATVSTLAGSGTPGYADGAGTTAQFSFPLGIDADAQGSLYVADADNNRIRKITPAGVVSTLAGSGAWGHLDSSIGAYARFRGPEGITADAQGNVYVAEYGGHTIRKITAVSAVTTIAGNGTAGFADGIATAALFNYPSGVTVDAQGNLYIADAANNRIRKITPAGVVTTIAGNGTSGYADGTGTAAQFNFPPGIVVDAQGNLYVADYGNSMVRKITPAGMVSTLAGNGTAGYADGVGSSAQFNHPYQLAIDAQGNLYVADYGNHRIRKVTVSGIVTTLAGSGTPGYVDGDGTTARFNGPFDIAVDAQGNLYVTDAGNNRIRKITMQ